MASQRAKQKRTAKHKSTRTGRPKAQSTPDPPPANRPRPKPTYCGATELLGPAQPGDGSRIEQDQQWVYHNNNYYSWDNDAGLINLPTIPEGEEGYDELHGSDMEEHEDLVDEGKEFDSDREDPGEW